MRDYISYFADSASSIKNGVSIRRDADWWAETIVHFLSKCIFLILIVFVVFLVSKFVDVLTDSEHFPLQKITIVGKVELTQDSDIKAALADINQDSFFEIDVGMVANQVKSIPWVEDVAVKRKWPAELELTVVERQPVIRWGDNEVMDGDGNRFVKAAHLPYTKLPKIEGIDGAEFEVFDAYQALSDRFEQLNDIGFDKFIQNEHLSFELYLKNGVVVKFGRDDYQDRLERFVKAYQAGRIPDLNKIKVVDFRYNKGFAVQWREEYLPQKENNEQTQEVAETRI